MRLIGLTYIFVTFLIFSCTDEPDQREYKIVLTNNTATTVSLEIFDSRDILVSEYKISANENRESCSYFSESFLGFACLSDSIIFKFLDNKEYACALRENGSQFCFSNKNPFNSTDFNELDNNTYEFVITQEDFENAFDLPE